MSLGLTDGSQSSKDSSPEPSQSSGGYLSFQLLKDAARSPGLLPDTSHSGQNAGLTAHPATGDCGSGPSETESFLNSQSIYSEYLSTQILEDQTHMGCDLQQPNGAIETYHAESTHDGIDAPLILGEKCWERIKVDGDAVSGASRLDSEGCFNIPVGPVFKMFLGHYFLHVHPMLPVLNEGDFWDIQDDHMKHRNKYPNVLLLQAMLFAACPYVAEDEINVLGFQNLRQAQACFYKHAKLLYNSQIQADRTLMAQTALLLTYWSSSLSSSEGNANSVWLSRAISHAKVLGADKCPNSPNNIGFTSFQQRKHDNALRRIWWCCIIRDRVLSLCVRRELQISQDYLDNHATTGISYDHFSSETERSHVYDADTKHSLITLMLTMTDLCLCLSSILTVAYPAKDFTVSDPRYSTRRILQTHECKKELENWCTKAVSSSSVMANTQHDSQEVNLPESSVLMFADLIWLYYHSARVTLCNCELLLGMTTSSSTSYESTRLQVVTVKKVRTELWEAATNITEKLEQLLGLGLARCLPSSAVACTALPLALHILDVKLSPTAAPYESINEQSRRLKRQSRLNILIAAMREYQPRYQGVDWVTRAIRYFIECTYFEPPVTYQDVSNDEHQITEQPLDVISQNPAYYFRMTYTLDLCLSQGRLPVESDFPRKLQSLISRTGCFIPFLFSQENDHDDDSFAVDLADIPSQRVFSEQEIGRRRCASPQFQDFTGWVENDRSLFFVQEMGLGL